MSQRAVRPNVNCGEDLTGSQSPRISKSQAACQGTWHSWAPAADPNSTQLGLASSKRSPAFPEHQALGHSRLHSCGCRLEAEQVLLGEPCADGDIIWEREGTRLVWTGS